MGTPPSRSVRVRLALDRADAHRLVDALLDATSSDSHFKLECSVGLLKRLRSEFDRAVRSTESPVGRKAELVERLLEKEGLVYRPDMDSTERERMSIDRSSFVLRLGLNGKTEFELESILNPQSISPACWNCRHWTDDGYCRSRLTSVGPDVVCEWYEAGTPLPRPSRPVPEDGS